MIRSKPIMNTGRPTVIQVHGALFFISTATHYMFRMMFIIESSK